MQTRVTGQHFNLGRLVITPAALTVCETSEINHFDLWIRHAAGDFGTIGNLVDAVLTTEIREIGAFATSDGLLLNALAIEQQQGMVMSVYPIPNKPESNIWIQTIQADSETYTTILLPCEY